MTKKYPGFMLGPLNLKINREVLVMIGPAGSGKTTLLNLIAGMIRPDEGSVILDGSDITNSLWSREELDTCFSPQISFRI